MRNPLNKRLPRELKGEAPKYFIIFLFMVIVIGFVSGFMVASGSIVKTYKESFQKYNIEDGNFELQYKADDSLIEVLRKENVTIYENFYIERETQNVDSTLRIYKNRDEVNGVCLMEGKLPVKEEEIAIDRMYASNNGLSVGDILIVDDRKMLISGLVALSDYSALYASPSDMMFDAIKFGVAIMSDEGYESLGEKNLHYCYSWKYENTPTDDREAKEMSEDFLKILSQNAIVISYIPMYSNQAIQFVGDDTGKDRMMFSVFLYIVVTIIAFIMAITISNTINREANVIGTLRATGYTKGELVRHYMTMPMFVILISALVGNIIGYTWFEGVAVDIYYENYSLPTYETVMNLDAFVKTTVIPTILMFVINVTILIQKLSLSPLKFIRRDLSRKKKKKAIRLNFKLPIMHRFRIRIILQNIPNYVIIAVGIFLANVILLLGMGFPKLLDNNQRLISENRICNYEYVLRAPAETKTQGAERYCVGSLVTIPHRLESESVTLYGVNQDSKYLSVDTDTGVYISKGYADKYRTSVGESITLREEFGTREYTFDVEGIYGNPTTMAVYMNRNLFNETFEHAQDYYNGYLSDEEMEDVDERLIATIITEDDLNKMSRQLSHSMGAVMDMFFWFGIVMFMLIVYLLSKIILEKNAQSISMTKILGYMDVEISRLYIMTTSIVVVLSFALTMPVVNELMRRVCEVMFSTFPGWMPYEVPFSVFVHMVVMGIVAYAMIAFVQFRRIKKIPLNMALKNVE